MTLHGALIVIASVAVGLTVASLHALDGAQAFIVCTGVWLLASALYHAAVAFLGAFGLSRRRGRR